MTILPAPTDRPEAPLFSDGLGDRVVAADGATGELLQILRIRPDLTAVPSFEFALRERTARLANFRHAYYARVRRVDRVQVPAPGLAVVSDHVEGTRLSEILRVTHERRLRLEVNAAMCLIRQLVPAVALLHENARDVAHGLLAPERLIVTPHARLVIVEHVLGSALEQLQYSRERLWQECRVAVAPSTGKPRFDHRSDVVGLGLVSLALLLGRPLRADEFPHKIPALLTEAGERAGGHHQPVSPALRDWLARTLQLDPRRSFASAPEAHTALEEVLADDSVHVAAPVALETFLSQYIAAVLEPAAAEEELALSSPPRIVATARQEVAPAEAPRAPASESVASLDALFPSETAAPVQAPPASVAAAHDIRELIAGDMPIVGPPAAKAEAPAPSVPLPPPQPARKRRFPRLKVSRGVVVAMAALVILAGGGAVAARYFAAGEPPSVQMGTLVVQSNPPGIQVFVDGIDRGPTPARVSVTPGAHILELRGRGTPRVIPFTASAGGEISHYLELSTTAETGHLRVESQPEGARVIVDGVDRGVAPVTVEDLVPGDHEVLLQSASGSARHVVNVQAGATAALVAPVGVAPANVPVSGWVSIKSPFTLEIREDGRVIGTTDADRLMMTAGRHEVQLVNDVLGFSAVRVINVVPGKVTILTIEPPKGVLHLNASPWAEVWIDGQRVGETPIGNLSVPIGPHEIVFRHPQFGERRQAVSVTAGAPVRVSVDMK